MPDRIDYPLELAHLGASLFHAASSDRMREEIEATWLRPSQATFHHLRQYSLAEGKERTLPPPAGDRGG
jgi:hypothetical protein